MNKFSFYCITVVLNIIYYVCKPAEFFAHAFNLKEISERLKNIPHWIVSSFTDSVEDEEDEIYVEESFYKAA